MEEALRKQTIQLTADELFKHIVDRMKRSTTITKETPIDIATYGLYLDISKGKDWGEVYEKSTGRVFMDTALEMSDNVRLLVGMSYFMECKPNCIECAENYNMRVDRLTDTIDKLNIKNVRVNGESHLKYYRIGKRVWIGGINLSGSKWVDVATEIYDEDAKLELNKIFEDHWNNSDTDASKYKKDLSFSTPLTICSNCSKELNLKDKELKFCPSCGYKIKREGIKI